MPLNPNSKEFSFKPPQSGTAVSFTPSQFTTGAPPALNPSSQAFRPSSNAADSSLTSTSKPAFNPTAPAFTPGITSQQTSAPYIPPYTNETRHTAPNAPQGTFSASSQLQASSKEFKPTYQGSTAAQSTPQITAKEFVPSMPVPPPQQAPHSTQKFKFVNSKPFYPLSDNQSSLFSQISKDSHSQKHTMKALFANENLRYFLLEKSLFRYQILHPQFVQFYFPMEVRAHALVYHSVFPLFQKYENSKVFENALQLGVFKAVQSTSNSMVTLVRMPEASPQSTNILRNYKLLNHPNVVKLKHHFYSSQFVPQQDGSVSDGMGGVKPVPSVQLSGVPSASTTTAIAPNGSSMTSVSKKDLVVVYDYIDYCESMYQLYIAQRILALPKEKDLWSFMCQIFSALEYIHSKGLWYGCMSLRKLLISPQMKRVHLNQVGLHAIFTDFKDTTSLERRQAEDVRAVAQVMVQLAHGSDSEVHDFDSSLYELRGKLSDELINVLERIMSETLTAKEVIEQFLGYHMMNEMIAMHRQANTIENELSKELENGRLFRLLVKLNCIMQRMNFDPYPHRWSEEGDLYILRLFYDHLFHSRRNSDSSTPVDWVHVIENLNKLDVGSGESVLLAAKNEQTILVVTYREIREIFVTQQWQA